MSRLLELLKSKPLTLIAHIPENNAEMAQAAENAGADAIMITKGYDEEKILASVNIPVGLDVLSAEPAEVEQLMKLKFDFIHFHPEALGHYEKAKKTKIAALDEEYTLDRLMSMNDKNIDAFDAAIVPPSQAAKELLVGDLQNYIAIALSSNLPIIIPTQRKIKSSEVAIVWDTGAKGLLLTSVVLGESVKSVEKAVKEYRAAVDDIG